MGKLIIGLVIGLALGVGGTLFLGLGGAMGVGVATGLSSGICMTVEAAQQMGLMTPEQVDEVLRTAAANVPGAAGVPADAEIVGSAAQCDSFMERLRSQG